MHFLDAMDSHAVHTHAYWITLKKYILSDCVVYIDKLGCFLCVTSLIYFCKKFL